MTITAGKAPSDFRLSLPRLLGFSTPGFCVGALAIALGVYLPRYYAGHFDLGLPLVGLAFSVIRVGDTLLDPLIGVWMDRTRSKLGRYRIWLAFGVPVLLLGVYMLFEAPAGVGVGYLLFWLLIYFIGASLITLSTPPGPRSSRPIIMSDHGLWGHSAHGRHRRRGDLAPPHRHGGAGRRRRTWGCAGHGWLVISSCAVGVLLALLTTPEHVIAEKTGETYTLRDYWEMVSRPDMARIIVADFCLALGPGWMAALYLYYFHDARGFTIGASSLLLFIYVCAGMLGGPILSIVATRIGKHVTLMGAAMVYSVGLVVQSFAPKGAFGIVAAMMFALGFAASCFPLLDRAMVADVGDAIRLEKGKNRISLLYAMITTTQKLATALSIGFSFTVLGWLGYQAQDGATNTPAAILGLQLVYILGPIVFVMIGGACFIGYKLDGKRHAEIRRGLAIAEAMSIEAPVLEGIGPG